MTFIIDSIFISSTLYPVSFFLVLSLFYIQSLVLFSYLAIELFNFHQLVIELFLRLTFTYLVLIFLPLSCLLSCQVSTPSQCILYRVVFIVDPNACLLQLLLIVCF